LAKQNGITAPIKLSAVGDVLLHGRVYGGLNKKENFILEKQMSKVKKHIKSSDLAIANLETPIAGIDYGLSGFPRFNAPEEIGIALKNLGIDIVSLANNHVLDQGVNGLYKTIENLEKIGLPYDGAFKSLEDSETLRVFNINNLKICILSFTSHMNGLKLPTGKEFLVNTLLYTSIVRISRLLRKIKREKIADVIILNMHFGEEYHLEPTARQKELARTFSDAGADVILGHHPHVLQPPEWIENSKGTKSFVAYSLGNFISGQNGLHRQIGAVLSLEISKPDDIYNNIKIENPRYNLTYVNREERLRYDVYPFQEWIKDNEYIITKEGKFESEEIYNNVSNRLTKYISNLTVT